MRSMKHGHNKRDDCSATYASWRNMIQRCINPKNPAYEYYGGRGITVCERWRTFSNFLSDMGERPHGLSLERIENNDGYTKPNCRWATRAEQSANTRLNVWITFRGKRQHLSALAREYGLNQ
jgi:hypothetical protein